MNFILQDATFHFIRTFLIKIIDKNNFKEILSHCIAINL